MKCPRWQQTTGVGVRRGAASGMAAMTWGTAVVLVLATVMPAAAQTLVGADLLTALRGGGYVIYFRHADTDPSRPAQPPVNFDHFATPTLPRREDSQNAASDG